MKKRPPRGRKAPRKLRIPDCEHFSGYKPCYPGTTCLEECADPKPTGKQILIINLEAMGNVLVTTTLLPALKRKYPVSTIRWITLANAAPLLAYNPLVNKVYVWGPESWLEFLLYGTVFSAALLFLGALLLRREKPESRDLTTGLEVESA